MTGTPALIDTLVGNLTPAPRAYVGRRLATGLGGGILVSAAIALALWGPRPDLAAALATPSFWAKFAFTGLLAASGIVAVARLARPGAQAPMAALTAALTVLAMAALAGAQFLQAPEEAHRKLVMGATGAACPWLIMGLAIPILAGGVWAMRAMAPTRLTVAGTAVGLAAGASAAFVYAVTCDEWAMPFVFLWYGIGIAVPTAVGGLLGRRLLHW